MTLEFVNANVTIYRKQGATQDEEIVLPVPPADGTVAVDIQRDKDATPVMPPWGKAGSEQLNSAYLASHLIYIDLTDDPTGNYAPTAGDRIVVANSGRLNGTWVQVAETVEETGEGMDYVALPCIRLERA